MSVRLNWRKIWKEFDKWLDRKDIESSGRSYGFPEWGAQARKINSLATNQLKIKLNWKNIWRDFNKSMSKAMKRECSAGFYFPKWSTQKQWVKKAVENEILNAEKNLLCLKSIK
jgi:hypothetical protein